MRTLFGTARRTAMTLFAALAFTLGGALTAASPALASGIDNPVDEGLTCRNQYGGPQFVAINSWGGPYGWACYSKSYGIPLAVTFNPVGDLKIQEYFCDVYYNGSTATVVNNFWVCRYSGNGGW